MCSVIMKCSECHHEWQTVVEKSDCRWCGSSGRPVSQGDISRVISEKNREKDIVRRTMKIDKDEMKRLRKDNERLRVIVNELREKYEPGSVKAL